MELGDEVTVPSGDTLVSVSAGTTVWVVHDRPESALIEVLVPGFGVHSIDRNKIRPEASGALPPQITCLEVRVDDGSEDFDGLLGLMEVVGGRLKRFRIYLEEFHPEFDIEICEVLRVCPATEFIELFGLHVTDFAKLSEFMETHECQLSVLEFGKRRLDDDQATIFFDDLKDPGSRMTQQIRELCVEFEKEVVSADTLVAIQEMLEINRTLEVFVLAVPIRCKDVAEKTLSLVPPVYLPRVRAPLPLRSKLAFISMTYASTKATSQLACLDSEVISIIFGFAVKHHNSELSLTSPQERFVDVAISAE